MSTLPVELNKLVLHQPKQIYGALFRSAWQMLNQFGQHADVQLGMIAVLHIRGQNISLHPHLHCIVPGDGIDNNGKWKKQIRSNKYLFSVKALSKVFRAKYVAELRAVGIKNKTLPEGLFKKDWVVLPSDHLEGQSRLLNTWEGTAIRWP